MVVVSRVVALAAASELPVRLIQEAAVGPEERLRVRPRAVAVLAEALELSL